MTRRSLLAAAAGTAATGLVRPVGALASLAGPSTPRLWQCWLGSLATNTPETIELVRPADMVGVQWQGQRAASIALRFRTRGGSWSAWVSAGTHGHGPEAAATPDGTVGDPIWTGGTTAVQLLARGALTDVRLHLIDVSDGIGAARATAASLALASPILQAGPGQPPILARSGWARGECPPRVAPAYGEVRMAFVHHTENPNGYLASEVPAMLRAIYTFHRYVNGWNDIGYNFVIDSYGRIFEARAGGIDEPVVGAQAGGYNLASTGVAVLGTFSSVAISKAARRALEALLAWKLSLHGVPSQGRVAVRVNPAGAVYSRFPADAHVSLPRIAGHRDADATDCPGEVLYSQLPAIRAGVLAQAPRPARATIALVPAATPSQGAGSSEPAGGGPMFVGLLKFLDGTPIVGANVLIQARSVRRRGEILSERTLAQATTDAQGQWSLAPAGPAPSHRMWLRALFAGSQGVGATVSPSLLAAFTPASVAPPTAAEPQAPPPSAAEAAPAPA